MHAQRIIGAGTEAVPTRIAEAAQTGHSRLSSHAYTNIFSKPMPAAWDETEPFSKSISDCVDEIKRVFARRASSTRELAKIVAAARNSCHHGEWADLCKSRRLPFSKRKADMLVTIGNSIGELNEQTFAHLPQGWSILYQLSRLARTVLLAAIRDGTIHPALTLQEAKDLLAESKGTKNIRKPTLRQRLQKFHNFIRTHFHDWTPQEQQWARCELLRLADQLGACRFRETAEGACCVDGELPLISRFAIDHRPQNPSDTHPAQAL